MVQVESIICSIIKSDSQNSVEKLEIDINVAKGEMLWVIAQATPFISHSNEKMVLLVFSDITEHKFNIFLKDYHFSILELIHESVPLEKIFNHLTSIIMEYFPETHCEIVPTYEESQQFKLLMDFDKTSKNSSFKIRTKELAEQLLTIALLKYAKDNPNIESISNKSKKIG